MLMCSGPDFGYIPQPAKSALIVNPNNMPEAQKLFGDLGLQIVSGHLFLGRFVGDQKDMVEYVESEVNKWVHYIEQLVRVS